jgi:ABC-type antimicrobial peptide transport system permease subunit
MHRLLQVFVEAVVVGVMAIIVGYLSGWLVSQMWSVNGLSEACKQWNKNYVMEKTLFLTGFLIHLLCEVSGINGWYCKSGAACLVHQ